MALFWKFIGVLFENALEVPFENLSGVSCGDPFEVHFMNHPRVLLSNPPVGLRGISSWSIFFVCLGLPYGNFQ